MLEAEMLAMPQIGYCGDAISAWIMKGVCQETQTIAGPRDTNLNWRSKWQMRVCVRKAVTCMRECWRLVHVTVHVTSDSYYVGMVTCTDCTHYADCQPPGYWCLQLAQLGQGAGIGTCCRLHSWHICGKQHSLSVDVKFFSHFQHSVMVFKSPLKHFKCSWL